MATKREELAVLIVNGRKYSDWESVSVRHEDSARPPFLCRFTCSEGMPIAANFAKLQIKPGDSCSVTLAGYPAFNGKVMTRQVFYDAHRHYIEIQAGSFTDPMTASTVSSTMEYKNVTFEQVARDQLKRVNLNLVCEGGSPPTKTFERVSLTHGESIIDLLETLARPLGITFSSNVQGDFVAVVGPVGGSDTVREGRDIIIGREIIYNEGQARDIPGVAQGPGSDKKHGAETTHQPFSSIPLGAVFGAQAPGLIPFELPTSDLEMLKGRVTSESNWLKDDEITVIITVYGWQKPSGGLWRVNSLVSVVSEMLMMNGSEKLKVKSVTFTQDNNTGTRTTLDLRNNSGQRPPVSGPPR
jgi:prophage tail gpP-like protein